jgi:hypothetical protein
MTDVLPLTEENISGLISLEFIPVSDLSSFPIPWEQEMSDAIALPLGKRFFVLAYSQQSGQFKCSEEKSPSGSVHKTTVSGFTPKMKLATEKQFALMRECGMAVKCVDSNGNVRVVGTPTEPLRFTFSEDSLPEYGGRSGYSWSFFRDLAEPPPYYTA